MKRWLVPAVPFAVSFALSLSTVGRNVYWQDSGLFLSAVKDLGVLYPPGFVPYVVLAKIWSQLFFFLDFTLAVHLFSSTCAAGAAAVLAVAARELFRDGGDLFRISRRPGPVLADCCAIAAGTLAATGYTFWFTGIYAKGYAFYYLVLSLLLWRLILADRSRAPRDFTIVAALIGLAWSAHPSSVCLAPALIFFIARHRDALSPREIAKRVGIAAAVALAPALVILPLLAARDPVTALGDPRSLRELVDYALGLRFMGRPGAFGIDQERVASIGRFLWEEQLGVGLVLLTIGLVSLVRVNRLLLLWTLAWIVPYTALAVLFKVEGQHDCWFVAAWLPLHLMTALGLWQCAEPLPARVRAALPAAAAVAGLLWSVQANRVDLDQRRYDMAALYGQVLMEKVDRDAILVLNGDDSLAICGYFQRVRDVRSDLTIVAQPFLGQSFVSSRDWYDAKILREHPFLRMPDYPGMRARHPGYRPIATHLAAFVHANAGVGRPIFMQSPLAAALLPRGYVLIPAGVLWKLVPEGKVTVNLDDWKYPLAPQDVQGRMGRERGLMLRRVENGLIAQAESYEQRLLDLLLKGRHSLGDVYLKAGRTQEAITVLEEVRLMDQNYDAVPAFMCSLGDAYHRLGNDKLAEVYLVQALKLGLAGPPRGWALYWMGEIREQSGRSKDALALYTEAADSAAGEAPLEAKLARKLPPR